MKKNKSKRIILLFFPILLLLLLGFLLIFGFFLPPQYGDTFLGELKVKLERVENTPGKRMILVGGSSVPFGIKSELLQDSFPDYTIVDFGMYAHMGTVVMLDLLKKNLHEDDLVLIIPEQNTQTLSTYFDGEDFWQAADGAFSMLSQLSSSRFEQLIATFPTFAGKKLSYFLHSSPKPDDIYARASFNEYGDISEGYRPHNIMDKEYNPNDLISFHKQEITSDFVDTLNDFYEIASSLDAKVYYYFCPINEKALEPSYERADVMEFYNHLSQNLTFPILGNPYESILESGWFYDTNFHLNDSGAIIYTKKLIEDIKTIFKDTSITDIPLPPIPSIPEDTFFGDDSDAALFTYESTEGGVLIRGLSDEGAKASSLVVPTSYEGQPVLGMMSTVFQENEHLEVLTIQPNIGILYDSMFSKCMNLKKIILTGSPSDYSIGDYLRKDADFMIYVPEAYLEEYRLHYSWQKYSNFLKAY